MRTLGALLAAAIAAAAGDSLADRAPAGAVAYFETRDLAGKLQAVLDSPLAEHPAVKAFRGSAKGKKLAAALVFVETALGMDAMDVARAVAGRESALALYPENRALFLSRVDARTVERLVQAVEMVTLSGRETVDPGPPAVQRHGRTYFFVDGDLLATSSDEDLLAAAAAARRPLSAEDRWIRARALVPQDRSVFGFVALEPLTAALRAQKPEQLGQALALGAMWSDLAHAPFAAVEAELHARPGTLRIETGFRLPPRAERPEAVEAAYTGALQALPFAMPEGTLAVARLRRDLEQLWTNREALLAESAVPGLVKFEGDFGNLSAGMSFVDEVLPALGDEIVLLATAPAPGDGPVRWPQGALLVPLQADAGLADRLAIAFQTAVRIVDIQQQRGLLLGTESFQGTTIHTARALDGGGGVIPALAVARGHLVLASSPGIVRDLLALEDGMPAAPVNAGVWLRGPAIAQTLEVNRAALVAQAMAKEGLAREEAEARVDGLVALARCVRDASLTVDRGSNLRIEAVVCR